MIPRHFFRTLSLYPRYSRIPCTHYRPLFQSVHLLQQHRSKPPQIEAKIPGWQEDLEPPAKTKLKLLFRDYGSSVVIVHTTISLISLGTCYTLVSLGVPMEFVMSRLESLPESTLKYATNGGTFALAYVFHKCLMPLRIIVTCTLTPLLVNYLRGKGILKSHKTS